MNSITYLQVGIVLILSSILFVPLIDKVQIGLIVFLLLNALGILFMIVAIVKVNHKNN